MDFPIYLAMTAAEMAKCRSIPPKIAYMACHFSAYGTGISNRPEHLPAGSVLILNDRTPIHKHDPQLISAQIAQLMDDLSAAGLLVDFQRPVTEEALEVIRALCSLDITLTVTEAFASEFNCDVLLSPAPLHMALQAHAAPWRGRKLWLELSRDPEALRLTSQGCAILPGKDMSELTTTHAQKNLHCHYQISALEEQAEFLLFRTTDDHKSLLQEAEALGFIGAVGLYQEFQDMFYSST